MILRRSKNKGGYGLGKEKGFTLIELLVVIAIIGVLSSIAITSLNGARKKARDARRLSDMEQIVQALEIYKLTYGHYPYNSDGDDNYGGWDIGYLGGVDGTDTFIKPLADEGLFTKVPGDAVGASAGDTYSYHRYTGAIGCDPARGAFYVVGVKSMETSGNPHPKSPGWNCGPGNRNWQSEFEWVTGGYEN